MAAAYEGLEEDARYWGNMTTMGILVGGAIGGLREAQKLTPDRGAALPSQPRQQQEHHPQTHHHSSSRGGGSSSSSSSRPLSSSSCPPPEGEGSGRAAVLTERDIWRMTRDKSERAFLRIARASIVGGARVGLFVAALGAVQVGMAHARGGRRDPWNSACAGAVAAGILGMTASPGSIGTRLSAAGAFAVFGGCCALPIGLLQSISSWSVEHSKSKESTPHPPLSGQDQQQEALSTDGAQVGLAIERLERLLRDRDSTPSA